MPLVSVIMPVYNGERYLKEAIESILLQTFKDFEFIIINDGSKDNSLNIIQSFKDSRVKIIDNENNLGIERCLNLGFSLASGKYIARMDCDDISISTRLYEQVKYMEANPDVVVCGSWIKEFGVGIATKIVKYKKTNDKLNVMLLFGNCMAHPSVIIRAEIIKRYHLEYSDKFKYAEDYELWTRLKEHGKLANLPKVLLLYRRCSNSIGIKNEQVQLKSWKSLISKNLDALAIDYSEEELNDHINLIRRFSLDKESIYRIDKWIEKLIRFNRNDNKLKNKILTRALLNYYVYFLNNCKIGLKELLRLKSSSGIEKLLFILKYYGVKILKVLRG